MRNNKFIIIALVIFTYGFAFSQKAEQKIYNRYLEEMQNKDYPKALEMLEKFIKKYPDSKNISEIYYDKALVNIQLNNNEKAFDDFTMAYKKDSSFADAVRLRGNLRYNMEKFDEALSDYNLAVKINPQFAEAYASKGFVYKKQSKKDEACLNFEKALDYGLTDIAKNIIEFCDSNSIAIQRYLFKTLTEKATNPEYGFSGNNPIKVGPPVKRQRIYLSLLRDSKGNPLTYKRVSSCCAYSSKNGMLGEMAMCDKYQVEFEGEIKILYLTLYDYEAPKIPLGFYSINDFQK